MTKNPAKQPNLEDSLAEITQLIDKMEHGELNLEQSLTYFERGITLIKQCQKTLTEAEQKVQLLIQQNQQETLSNFGEENDDNE
jgi:exodeoxyribonuclease VII small subunit